MCLLALYLLQRRHAIAHQLAARNALQRAHDQLEVKVEQRTAEKECASLTEKLAQAVRVVDPDAGQRISALAEMLRKQGFESLRSEGSDAPPDSSPKPGRRSGK